MNSHSKENLIIFAMVLVPTCFDTQIKIKIFSALESQPWVKLDKNLYVAQVWCKSMKKVVLGQFWSNLTFGQPRFDQEHFDHFDWKRHFECSNARTGCATSYGIYKNYVICKFYKVKGHTMEHFCTHACILQNMTVLANFEFSTPQVVLLFILVKYGSSTTPTFSMVDVQALITLVLSKSSSASNSSLAMFRRVRLILHWYERVS